MSDAMSDAILNDMLSHAAAPLRAAIESQEEKTAEVLRELIRFAAMMAELGANVEKGVRILVGGGMEGRQALRKYKACQDGLATISPLLRTVHELTATGEFDAALVAWFDEARRQFAEAGDAIDSIVAALSRPWPQIDEAKLPRCEVVGPGEAPGYRNIRDVIAELEARTK